MKVSGKVERAIRKHKSKVHKITSSVVNFRYPKNPHPPGFHSPKLPHSCPLLSIFVFAYFKRINYD
jgi:hypothetical protein